MKMRNASTIKQMTGWRDDLLVREGTCPLHTDIQNAEGIKKDEHQKTKQSNFKTA